MSVAMQLYILTELREGSFVMIMLESRRIYAPNMHAQSASLMLYIAQMLHKTPYHPKFRYMQRFICTQTISEYGHYFLPTFLPTSSPHCTLP